jgi:protein-S-isoprenylcysteine O-methyltransferase Ste14
MDKSSDPNTAFKSGVKIPPPLIYVTIFGVGFLLQTYFPFDMLPPSVSRILALLCMAVSAVLGVWSFVSFRRARTSPLPMKPSTALITVGPYRFSRNPMYVSVAFMYTGLAFWFAVFWALVLLPIVIVAVRYCVIAGEERYLERTFGQAYIDYKTRVRRWL